MGRRGRLTAWIVVVAAIVMATLALGLFVWLDGREPAARIAWRYQLPGEMMKFTLYPIPQRGLFAVEEKQILLLDDNGAMVARHDAPQGRYFGNGTTDAEGNLYLGELDSAVSAYDPAGRLLWRCVIEARKPPESPYNYSSYAGPVLGTDGKLHLALMSGRLVVLTRRGQIERSVETGIDLSSSTPPAIAPEGGYYLVADDNSVLLVSAGGKVLWRYPAAGKLPPDICSGPDGAAYFVQFMQWFHALNPDGTQRWEFHNPDPSRLPGYHMYWFNAHSDGVVYISSGHGLTAFNPDGTVLWRKRFRGECSAVFSSANCVYLELTEDSYLAEAGMWLKRVTSHETVPSDPAPQADHLLVFDARSGDVLKRYSLPDGTMLKSGPGPRGEFYCHRWLWVTDKKDISRDELLRIELDK